jgi:hypothetical protein
MADELNLYALSGGQWKQIGVSRSGAVDFWWGRFYSVACASRTSCVTGLGGSLYSTF